MTQRPKREHDLSRFLTLDERIFDRCLRDWMTEDAHDQHPQRGVDPAAIYREAQVFSEWQ